MDATARADGKAGTADLFGFSQIEESILGGEGGAAVASTLQWLAETREAVTGWLDAGVTTQDAEDGTAVLNALGAAERILKSPDPGKGARHG